MNQHVTRPPAFPGMTLECPFDATPGIAALFGHSGSEKLSLAEPLQCLLHPVQAAPARHGQAPPKAANPTAPPQLHHRGAAP